MAAFMTFFDGSFTQYELVCLKSFVDFGHSMTVFSYDESICPNFCAWQNANEVIPIEKVFRYQSGPGAGSISAFSNLFRYVLLSKFDMCWVDTDVLCLSSEWPEDQFVFGWQDEFEVNAAVLKIPVGHSLLDNMIKICEKDRGESPWGTTGPMLLTDTLKEFNLINLARNTNDFYPIGWRDAYLLHDPSKKSAVKSVIKQSFCIHLWNEMMRRLEIDKNQFPLHGSFMYDIFRAT